MSYTKQQVTAKLNEQIVTCDNKNTAKEIADHISKKNVEVLIEDQVIVNIKRPAVDVEALLGELGFRFETQYPNNQRKYSRSSPASA